MELTTSTVGPRGIIAHSAEGASCLTITLPIICIIFIYSWPRPLDNPPSLGIPRPIAPVPPVSLFGTGPWLDSISLSARSRINKSRFADETCFSLIVCKLTTVLVGCVKHPIRAPHWFASKLIASERSYTASFGVFVLKGFYNWTVYFSISVDLHLIIQLCKTNISILSLSISL